MRIYYAHPTFMYGTESEKRDLETIMRCFQGARIMNPAKLNFSHKERMPIYAYYASLHDIIVYRPVVGRFITAGVYEELKSGLLKGVKIARICKNGDDRVIQYVDRVKDYPLTLRETKLLSKALKFVSEQTLIDEISDLRCRYRITPRSALILTCTKISSKMLDKRWIDFLQEFVTNQDSFPRSWLEIVKKEEARERIFKSISVTKNTIAKLIINSCFKFIESPELKQKLRIGKYSMLPERLLAYHYAIILRKDSLSYKRIAREIWEVFGLNVNTGEVCNWVKGKYNPLHKCGRINDCPELGYVLAAWLGDGTLAMDNNGFKHYVILVTTDLEFAQEWGKCLAKVTGNPKPYKPRWDKSNERWIVKASNILLWMILTIAKEDPWFIYPILEKYPKSACKGWFDAEGYVSPSSYLIGATNSDIEQVCLFQKLLEKLSIGAEIRSRNDEGTTFTSPRSGKISRRLRTNYELKIYGKENHKKFAEFVGFTIPRKLIKLEELVYKRRK